MGVENIKIEPMTVYYGKDTAQVEKLIVPSTATKASLSGDYFFLYMLNAGVIEKHGFSFDDTGAVALPVISGVTFHEIDVAAASTVALIATAIASAVDALAGWVASVSNNEVTITHAANGYACAAHDALTTGKTTGFGFQLITQGDLKEAVGLVQGSIKVGTKMATTGVKAQSEGATEIAELRTGIEGMSVELELLESVKAKIKRIMVKSNGSYIPDGGTEVFGIGSYKNGVNLFNFAAPLVLHPKRLLVGDLSEDWNWPKAFPILDNVDMSGEEALVLPVSFKCWPDSTLNERINLMYIGDGSQTLTAIS